MLPTIPSLRKPEYQISNSLRFRSSASAYLSRTPSVTGSQTTWTWSGWIKRGALAGSSGTVYGIFGAGTDNSANRTLFWFDSGDKLVYQQGNTSLRTTTAVFRDTSAWGHLVVAVDNSNSTAANRILMYWNGVLLATTGTGDPGSTQINLVNVSMKIGTRTNPPTTECFDGYMAEVHFVDGQALTPASFGATSSKTGVWAPRKYTGTYGTNGFYLDFVDNSAATSAAIGKDRSGNYNSWTPTNISMVAGSTYDSMTDTPTQYGDAAYYYSGTQYPYNALNFRSGSSSYLSRAFAANSSSTAWTYSGWVKRSQLGVTAFGLLGGSVTNNNQAEIWFNSSDQLVVNWYNVSSQFNLITTQVFNDTTAWYHIVVAFNSTDTTPSNRLKIYINGVQVTSFSTASYPGLNVTPPIYTNVTTHIGRYYDGTSYYGAGYMADINFVDTQALTPAAFAETINGTWVPKTYTGTYGTNGFNLKFNDNSAATAAALGRDSAGTNNWTPTNLATTDVTSTELTSRRLVNPSYGLQFRSSASAYLSRTPASAGNQTTWTWSGWFKRGTLGTSQVLFTASSNSTTDARFWFDDSNLLNISYARSGSADTGQRNLNQVFINQSTWNHIIVATDTTQPVVADMCKVYVNGVQVTSFASTSNPPQNTATPFNASGNTHQLGGSTARGWYFDGVLADINFIDGQALTPSSFGETDSTGTWVPKAYSGTYGTNGFYLNFADRSAMTAATIGNDASSNSNNWTPTNMAIADAIDYGARTARGNYAVLNPLIHNTSGSAGVKNSNLSVPAAAASAAFAIPNNIQFYFEIETGNNFHFSFKNAALSNVLFRIAGGYVSPTPPTGNTEAYYYSQMFVDGTGSIDNTNPGGNQIRTGIFGLAVNKDAGTLLIYHQGVQIGSVTFNNPSDYVHFYIIPNSGTLAYSEKHINFGQRPFAYTPPTGFKALCTHNLPDPAIVHGHAYMAATTYTGTGVGRNISNFSNNRSFRPDLVWIKSRSNATDHALYDTLRGAQQDLVSNSTAAETTQSTGLTAFNEDGFGLSTLTKLNSAGNTYVAWQWKAGDGVVTNTAGSITSQVDANPTAGLSIVTYTGTGANATVGHGLGVAPKMIITKDRDTVVNWVVYHESMGGTSFARFNTTDAKVTDATIYNGTPSSTVFNIGTGNGINGSTKRMVSYCFAEIAGYSKFGSYTGNGSADGPFVFCGFRPRWILYKNADSVQNWVIWDTTRTPGNAVGQYVFPNTAAAEATSTNLDILSNGFKLRTTDTGNNGSGNTMIYAAFAEVPSKYALAR